MVNNVSFKCDDEIIYDGNVAEIENMLQEGAYVFRDRMRERMKEFI